MMYCLDGPDCSCDREDPMQLRHDDATWTRSWRGHGSRSSSLSLNPMINIFLSHLSASGNANFFSFVSFSARLQHRDSLSVLFIRVSLFFFFIKSLISDHSNRSSMSIRTVKVSNVSLGASQQDIKEFFSFSGDIEYVEMQSMDEQSQIAYVTFKDPQGAETAILLSGATIVDKSVTITSATDYQPPPVSSAPPSENKAASGAESAVKKAEDVVSSMLAKGFVLGKDAVNKAKTFDEKHQFTSTATAKVADLDKRIGLSEKISIGTSVVNDKFKEMDQKFQVSEKTKSAFTAAEQQVSSAGSAIMKNRYVLTGASWVTGAFNRVAKAAVDVGTKTKEMVAEEEQKKEAVAVGDYAPIHLNDSPKAASGEHSSKPPPAQGLIL